MIRGVERIGNRFLLFCRIKHFKWKLLTVREAIAVAYQPLNIPHRPHDKTKVCKMRR